MRCPSLYYFRLGYDWLFAGKNPGNVVYNEYKEYADGIYLDLEERQKRQGLAMPQLAGAIESD